eukprot:382213_1
MAILVNNSAKEQFIQIEKFTQKLATVNNVGKFAKETIFYGNTNINTDLKPKIINAIGKNSKLSTSSVSWYTLIQEDIFGFVPVNRVVKFRDQNKQHINLPQYILKSMQLYIHAPYYVVAINVKNQYKKYAQEHLSNREVASMTFLNQLLFEINKNHYITLHGTCAKYSLEDNKLSAECDLLSTILKRTPTQIECELKQHKNFDPKQLNHREEYYNKHSYDTMNLHFYSLINSIELPLYKPGQIYVCDFTGATSLFYVSLFKEDPDNRMALKWLMEHGFFGISKQKELLSIFGHEQPMDLSLCW